MPGFLAENRLTGLRADLDVYVTFEGDNTVLLQLVGKRLLTEFRAKAPKDAGVHREVRRGQVAASKLADASGIRRLGQTVADRGSLAASVADLQDPRTQRELLAGRVDTMVAEIGMRLASAGKDRARAARLLNRSQHELIEASKAHAELMQWDAFTEALDEVTEGDTRRVLVWLRDLFALGLLEQHLDWYLLHGRLSAQRARAVSAYIDRLVARVRPDRAAADRDLRLRARSRPRADRARCGAGPTGGGTRVVRRRGRRRSPARTGEEAPSVTDTRPRP